MSSYAAQLKQTLHDGMQNIIYGLDETIHGLCIALISQGHVLLEGVPGVGKTLLAKTLSHLLGGEFKRIQCTADLMPSDITGIHLYNTQKQQFEFVPGPLFANVVLVDEINRSGPKTQSALLQAMEELHVTIDRDTFTLPTNFFLIASQNPHEFEGTYPLPESQLDRFLLRLIIQYPNNTHEEQILRQYDKPGGGHTRLPGTARPDIESLIQAARQQVEQIHVADAIYQYIIAIANASRTHQQIELGLSTRGALGLIRCARVNAAIRDSTFVTPDDIKSVANSVMAHRLVLTTDAALENTNQDELVQSILKQIPVPKSNTSDSNQ